MSSRRARLPSIRVRLTLWNVAVILFVLAVYAGSVFTFVSRNASNALDQRLNDDFQWPREMLTELPDGRIGTDDASSDTDSSPWLQVWSPGGAELLYSTRNAERNPVPQAAELAARADDGPVRTAGNPSWRVLSRESVIDGRPVVIQVALSEFEMGRDLNELLLVLLLGLPLGVAAAGLAGYSLARRALAPVNRMAERARSITAESLEDRLPVDNPADELGRLATVFNDTLTRLESSFDQMRRFTADASHELRTPLTAIRSVGEVALRSRRDEDGYREVIGSMLEEAERLAALVDRLLLLSKAELGEMASSPEPVELEAMVREVSGQLEVLAEEKEQSIIQESSGATDWWGDAVMLRQALRNLVDNAIKYTPRGGTITIRVMDRVVDALIEVSDTGPGIPPELESRIFDRFYRMDGSRSRENGGSGLGLSIARWAVESTGGRLSLRSIEGVGSTFRITLPLEAGVPKPTSDRHAVR